MQQRWQIVELFKSCTILLAAFIRTNSRKPHHDERVITLLSKKKKTTKYRKNNSRKPNCMKSLFIIFLFGITINALNAQDKRSLGKRLIIGTSISYLNEVNRSIPNRYHEFVWNKNIATNITSQLYAGISHQNIYTTGSTVLYEDPKEKYYLVGVFMQYDFWKRTKDRVIAEVSWNYGNYCTCGWGDPFKQDALNYIGVGGGIEKTLTKHLTLDLSMMFNTILQNIENKYGYNRYAIGLNFDFDGTRK